MKTITINDVKIQIIPEYDDIPVRGNALVSGNDDEDKECEDAIIERLENGDVWAWASVEVKCTYKGILEASDYLGACCYEDEADFKKDGYYDDMVNNCINDLQKQLEELCECTK